MLSVGQGTGSHDEAVGTVAFAFNDELDAAMSGPIHGQRRHIAKTALVAVRLEGNINRLSDGHFGLHNLYLLISIDP